MILKGKAGRLAHEMDHYAFPTIEAWVSKHNRYSNWEAALLNSSGGGPAAAAAALDPALSRKRRLKHLSRRVPGRPTLRFLYHYVLRAGFLDGYRGFVFCRLMSFYELLSSAKAAEARGAAAPSPPGRQSGP